MIPPMDRCEEGLCMLPLVQVEEEEAAEQSR